MATRVKLHMNKAQWHRNLMTSALNHGHWTAWTVEGSEIILSISFMKIIFTLIELTSISDPVTVKFLKGGSLPLMNSKTFCPFLCQDTLYNLPNSMLCLQCSRILDPFSTNFFVINSTSTSISDCPSVRRWKKMLKVHY